MALAWGMGCKDCSPAPEGDDKEWCATHPGRTTSRFVKWSVMLCRPPYHIIIFLTNHRLPLEYRLNH